MCEVLKIQGVSTAQAMASWYASYAAQFALFNAVIALATTFPALGTDETSSWPNGSAGGTFSHSAFSVLFVFFFLYSMAFVAKGPGPGARQKARGGPGGPAAPALPPEFSILRVLVLRVAATQCRLGLGAAVRVLGQPPRVLRSWTSKVTRTLQGAQGRRDVAS